MGMNKTVLWILFGLITISMAMNMDEPTASAEFQRNSLHKNWASKTIHFLVSMTVLIPISSIATVYTISNNFKRGWMIQFVCFVYLVVEVLFLPFHDWNGYENVSSRGVGVFLLFFYMTVLVIGGIVYKFGGKGEGWMPLQHNVKIPERLLTLVYKITSCMLVLNGMIKLSMNAVSMLGFCYDSHTGQCNAHGIMGMSFVFYGFILLMMLIIPWLRNNSGAYSQEFYDSVVIMLWGIVNTFTEHRPWEPWSHGDYQHTSMGIVFWACGMLGVVLSWGRKRNFVPALTLIFTGYAMSEHVQELIISTKVHGFFGNVLMVGGMCRILEISFLLGDEDSKGNEIMSFQYIPPFALVLAGILFMGANEEQLELVVNLGSDHSSYVLVLISGACIVYMWMILVLRGYLTIVGGEKNDEEEIELSDMY